VIGDPTEAALVVLAAKLGVDAEETRRAYPRLAEVPFDSEYKFMATFHTVPVDGVERVIELVKGAPDLVLARCSHAGGPLSGSQVPIEQAADGISQANDRMGGKGLRVLAYDEQLEALRLLDENVLGTESSVELEMIDASAMPWRLSLQGLCQPRIEPEIAFGLRAAPRAGMALTELQACIDWVAHAFEIVHTHFEGWRFTPAMAGGRPVAVKRSARFPFRLRT